MEDVLTFITAPEDVFGHPGLVGSPELQLAEACLIVCWLFPRVGVEKVALESERI